MANIKVAVRVRPISTREIKITGPEIVVHTESKKISLINPKVPSSRTADSRKRVKLFYFDYCFDSSDPIVDDYAGQEKIYKTLGTPVLDAFLSGFNASVVAYGQSASGKSYTMMGTENDPGIIPRICSDLFSRASDEEKNGKFLRFFVSYLEIYNERVKDLLNTSMDAGSLRIREHPRFGPYVEGLTQFQVKSLGSLMSCLKEGTQARKTASTLQNLTSSRSHALLTLSLEFSNSISEDAMSKAFTKSQKKAHFSRCKLCLVDLAGSEKSTACAGINRLKSQEGANINKSLVALGNVISALAERGSTSHVAGKRFIPYRDSTLTWLLKDSFGGNATTIMLATISPASGSYNETAHTLRFAQRAQSVVNKPVISEDPVSKIIRELQAEILRLKAQLLEKDTTELTDDYKLLCSCRKNQDLAYTPRNVDDKNPPLLTYDNFNLSSTVIFRRHSFDDYLNSKLIISNPLKKLGSLESISDLKNFNGRNSNSRKNKEANILTSVDNHFDESAFVDIPTLVAVLINADANTIEEDTHQIEELSTSSTHVDPIDDRINTYVNNDIILAKQELPSESQDEKVEDKKSTSSPLPVIAKKSKLKQSLSEVSKQPAISSSQENIEKASDECNHHSTKKVNCLKDNGKEKVKNVVVKVNNDKETKITSSIQEAAIKKQSSENTERNTSGAGGSNSSKDDCLLTTEIIKNTRRNSTDPEQLLPRQHTVIQRARRAEIVAAVTERLYSSKKLSDDSNTASTSASDIRSPEISEVKFPPATRMRLREISRKMLAKRRRVCVDTQTDIYPTVRVRDVEISAEEPKIIYKDVSVLTDRHEDFESLLPCTTPVIRLKEVAVSTIDPAFSKPTILLKDVGSVTDQYDNEIIPSCSNHIKSEHSTNTYPVNESKHSCIQTTHSDILIKDPHPVNNCELKHIPQNDVRYLSNQSLKCCPSMSLCTDSSHHSKIIDASQCCPKILEEPCQCSLKNSEKNTISLSVPDTINIVIESSNIVDSKLQIVDDEEYQQKDENIQTENKIFSDVGTSTNNVIKVNIRESWTNTRSVDEQTNTKPFRFQRLLDDLYKTSKSSRISTPDTAYDFDGPSNSSFEGKFNKTGTPSLNSYHKNNTTKTKEWLTKNQYSWMTYPNNNGLRHLVSSPRNKFNYLNVDNVIQSKLNIKTRNTLRHYSWRNIRRARSNSFDKKLRQWNRINFSNQMKNIRRKTPELLWTDNNNLLYFKTFDNNYFCKKKSNVPDDSHNLKQVETKCTDDVTKTDIMSSVKNSERRREYLIDNAVSKNEQVCSFHELRGEPIDELKKKLENLSNEIATTLHEFNPCLANVFLIPITLTGNETAKNCQSLLEKMKKNKTVIPIQPEQFFCSSSSTALESHSQQIPENGLTVQPFVDFAKLLQNPDGKTEARKSPVVVNSSKLKNISTNVKNISSLNSSENASAKNNSLIKDYLKETIIFMRNVNLLNELVNAEVNEKKLSTKPRNASNKKLDKDTENNHKIERNTLDRLIIENLLNLDENKFKKHLRESNYRRSNTQNHRHLLNSKEENYHSRSIKINDEDFSLELNNFTIKEFVNGRAPNNYLKQRSLSSKMKKRRHAEYCPVNKNANSKLENDFTDDKELNSQIYLKITKDENELVSKGRKLLSSPSRYTIPRYDSSTENSSSNEAFNDFIESLRYNYKYRNKYKVPESPRLKLLQLLNERRQIIETSRELWSP